MYLRYTHYIADSKEATQCGIRISDIVDFRFTRSDTDEKRHEINILVRGDTRPRFFKGETALDMYEQLRDA
jgi:hypothetical protein